MNQNELYHFGIQGMKWGIRGYQNADGSLTAKGKRRITKMTNVLNKKYSKYKSNERENSELNSKYNTHINNNQRIRADNDLSLMNYNDEKSQYYRDSSKNLIKKVSKLDPKLGKKLSNEYSDLLNKTFIGDFTLSELRKIQKDPDHLDEKAKKFIDQQMTKQLAVEKSKIEYNQRRLDANIQMQMQQQQAHTKPDTDSATESLIDKIPEETEENAGRVFASISRGNIDADLSAESCINEYDVLF